MGRGREGRVGLQLSVSTPDELCNKASRPALTCVRILTRLQCVCVGGGGCDISLCFNCGGEGGPECDNSRSALQLCGRGFRIRCSIAIAVLAVDYEY